MAYSDLPGLTAWLTRLAMPSAGTTRSALRAPFLLLAAALPWLVARITAREFAAGDIRRAIRAWQAGAALLLPLAGDARPARRAGRGDDLRDAAVPGRRLAVVGGVDATAALELAAGLAIGALSHYRFIAVIGVGPGRAG